VIPPEGYRPAAGWYRHHDVLRWYDGHEWTDRTKPLPKAGPSRREGSVSLAAAIVGLLALALTVIVLGVVRVIP
jgi:hypothetical protein